MATGRFWALLPAGVEPDPTVVELFLQLEENGWYPQRFLGARGIKYWPETQRSRQIVIDIAHPINEHKLDFYREHTQLNLVVSTSTQQKEV